MSSTSEFHDIVKRMFRRILELPEAGVENFFLWGPRQAGKSTLLRSSYPNVRTVNLLRADEFRAFTSRPEMLREQLLARPSSAPAQRFVIIDEIQKVPALLDEVHLLIEEHGFTFGLCGSSARKVKRGAANLLGGRAVRYELQGLCFPELATDFDLGRLLNHGYLPSHYLIDQPRRRLQAYVGDYLKEEVAAEGLVRQLPVFSRFLDAAALADCEQLQYATLARDFGVSGHTVASYFEILEDTLLGKRLEAFRARPKRRQSMSPKFYFFDVGLVNVLAKRRSLEAGSAAFGKAFENWVFHELYCHSRYHNLDDGLSFWRLSSGPEVDFIVGNMHLAIEAKATRKVTSDHLKGLRELAEDHAVKHQVVVSLETRARKTDDGILILPAAEWARDLWSGRWQL